MLYRVASEKPQTRELILWIGRKAAEQAGSRVKEWNYESWLKSPMGQLCNENGDWAIFGFLSDTHSRLDHTDKWHLKVISRDLDNLISSASDALCKKSFGGDRIGWDRHFRPMIRRYPELKGLMEKAGLVYDEVCRGWKLG